MSDKPPPAITAALDILEGPLLRSRKQLDGSEIILVSTPEGLLECAEVLGEYLNDRGGDTGTLTREEVAEWRRRKQFCLRPVLLCMDWDAQPDGVSAVRSLVTQACAIEARYFPE